MNLEPVYETNPVLSWCMCRPHIYRINCLRKRSHCEKPILQSSWHRRSINIFLFVGASQILVKVVTPKCLGILPVVQDRLNAHPCSKDPLRNGNDAALSTRADFKKMEVGESFGTGLPAPSEGTASSDFRPKELGI
ncbi:hypothetical protein TNCV_3288521 [Trichonephila clavipes]|nr:hypothetical protein TNCV_3288521 [Trichonephila clavipes]